MTLLALAIAPGIAICIYFFLNDLYNKEPKRILLASFLLGMLTIFPPYFFETSMKPLFDNSISGTAFYAFGVVALSEELCKYLVLRYYCYTRRAFDEPMDGIIYSIMVSMGFATLENINYVYLYGYGTAFIRMFLSVPAHASFAMVIGYYVGKAKFDSEKSFMLLLKGLAIAVLFHGLFDFFIFLQNSPQISQYLTDGLLFAGAVGSYYISMKLGMKLFRQHQQLSRQNFKKEENV